MSTLHRRPFRINAVALLVALVAVPTFAQGPTPRGVRHGAQLPTNCFAGDTYIIEAGASAGFYWAQTGGSPCSWQGPSGSSGAVGTVTNTGVLTLHQLVIGNGGVDVKVLGSLGTAGQVLTSGGAGADPSWSAVGSGTVTSVATTAPITGGPITTTGTIACATCATTSATLTANRLLLGNGTVDLTLLGSLGTTTTVLHGNAAGAPTFGAVDLANDTSGNLGVSHLNSGTSASNTTFWRGDATWATPSGSGTVSTTGSPASGNLAAFSGATSITNTDLTGDVTTSGGVATTLANTAVSAGSYTTASITVDAKGRLTAASTGTPAVASSATQAATADTTITPQDTRTDITGATLTLAAGTWLLQGTFTMSCTTTTYILGVLATSANANVISVASSGLNGYMSMTTPWVSVTIGSSTTYKLRAQTGSTSCIVRQLDNGSYANATGITAIRTS